MNIIDIHIHPDFAEIPGKSGAQMARMTLEEMDRAGVAISAVLGQVRPFQSAESVRAGNDYTLETVRARPDRLFGFCFVNPALPKAFVEEEIDRCLEMPEFRAIKLELDVNCRDPRLDVVMERAMRHDVPVLHHAWYVNLWSMANPAGQAHRSEPHDVAALARRFPEVKIIMAHLEGSGIRGVLDVAELDNVWIDTSGSQPFSGTLEYAVEEIGSSRILFGSDLFGRGLESQLGRVLGSCLATADLENILFRNAQALFGLSSLPAPSNPEALVSSTR